MDKDKARAMVLASLIGDALALGPHWFYDPNEILRRFGRISTYVDPPRDGYHSGKRAGDFTHYGDQVMALLHSVADNGHFDLQDFSRRWRALFKNYKGYIDQATTMTLQNYEMGKPPEESGSISDDLAGASRISPLLYCYRENLNDLLSSARAQTAMTHAAPITIDSALFFSKLGFEVLHGEHPIRAIEKLLHDTATPSYMKQFARMGLESSGKDSLSTIMQFGQSCHSEEALPCVIHLIAKYPDSKTRPLNCSSTLAICPLLFVAFRDILCFTFLVPPL